MSRTEKNVSISGTIILILVFASALFLKIGFIQNSNWYWGLAFTLPFLLIAIVDVQQSKNASFRKSPIVARLRCLVKKYQNKVPAKKIIKVAGANRYT